MSSVASRLMRTVSVKPNSAFYFIIVIPNTPSAKGISPSGSLEKKGFYSFFGGKQISKNIH